MFVIKGAVLAEGVGLEAQIGLGRREKRTADKEVE